MYASGSPVQRIVRFRGHEQPQHAAEDGSDSYAWAVAGGEDAVADAATAVDVAVVDLQREEGRSPG